MPDRARERVTETLIDRRNKICYSLKDIQKREGSRTETYLEASFLLLCFLQVNLFSPHAVGTGNLERMCAVHVRSAAVLFNVVYCVVWKGKEWKQSDLRS